jgi:chromosomal replication initiator protein
MLAWENFLLQQENELGNDTVQKWLRSLTIQRYDACNLYLEAKDSFQALWFEEHMRAKALNLVNGNNKQIKIHLSVPNSPPPASTKNNKSKYSKQAQTNFQLNFDDLDPTCLFSHFVITEENQIPCQLIKEITTSSISSFNPFYLYGSSGSGKTHLLMSIAHAARQKKMNVIYVRAETFTDHVVAAIRGGEMTYFRNIYRNVDVLIIDDVHILSRKTATQEELFHTFNTLHLAGKQIILSANCSPQELQLIEPRLVSRFEWGIVLPLKILDGNQREKMLEIKSKALNFPLPKTIIEFLVQTFTSNPKALTKAFEALVLRLHLDSQQSLNKLSLRSVQVLLSDLILEEQKSILTPERIVQAVAEQYGLRLEDILGKSQTRECVLPRQMAMLLCREKLKMPYMKIGELFSRDHSTVMSGVKQIQKVLENDNREMANAWHSIQKRIQT